MVISAPLAFPLRLQNGGTMDCGNDSLEGIFLKLRYSSMKNNLLQTGAARKSLPLYNRYVFREFDFFQACTSAECTFIDV